MECTRQNSCGDVENIKVIGNIFFVPLAWDPSSPSSIQNGPFLRIHYLVAPEIRIQILPHS